MGDSFNLGPLKIEKQAFAGVTMENKVFDDAAFDGLIGLAYNDIGDKKNTPLFDNIMKQNL